MGIEQHVYSVANTLAVCLCSFYICSEIVSLVCVQMEFSPHITDSDAISPTSDRARPHRQGNLRTVTSSQWLG